MDNNEIMFIDSLRAARVAGAKLATSLAAANSVMAEFFVYVLDMSSSMSCMDFSPSRYLAGAQAILQCIEARLNVSPCEYAALVTFNMNARIVCEQTRLSDAIPTFEAALSEIRPNGGTEIAEGLQAAGRILAYAPEEAKKRIVLLTDGHGGRPERVASILKHSGVIIDVIGIGGSPAEVDEHCLRRVASVVDKKTRYRFIGHKDELLTHFKNIATDLMHVRG